MNEDLNKIIFKNWLNDFPHLEKYDRNKILKVLGPLLVGLELVRLPFSQEYRPYLVFYMLWKQTIKDCLLGPILLLEIYSETGSQISVPYDSNNEYYNIAVNSIKAQFSDVLSCDVSLTRLLNLMDKLSPNSPRNGTNSYLAAKFKENQLNIAICTGNDQVIQKTLDEIKAVDWNLNHFAMFDMTLEKWYKILENMIINNKTLIKNVKSNQGDKRNQKLQFSRLT